jgi:hypothetical protein
MSLLLTSSFTIYVYYFGLDAIVLSILISWYYALVANVLILGLLFYTTSINTSIADTTLFVIE